MNTRYTIFFITVVLGVLLLSPAVQAGSKENFRLYATASGKAVSVAELQNWDYDVLIFGEYHDNPVLHGLEAELLKQAFARHSKLAISLEMFERDVQQPLDAYLAGEISESAFLEQARPWNNYQQSYRPLVEFARVHKLPVLAANIPRSVASHYARQGTLDGIDMAMQPYLPVVHRIPDGEYKRRFFTHMQELSTGNSGMKVAMEKLEAFYQAQCLKDDAMAESIVRYHDHNPGGKVIHYQGDFHSRFRLGVAGKVQALAPALKMLVLTPVYVAAFTDLAVQAKRLQADGDIVVFIRQDSSVQ